MTDQINLNDLETELPEREDKELPPDKEKEDWSDVDDRGEKDPPQEDPPQEFEGTHDGDTIPPPAGADSRREWLEQFPALSQESLSTLKKVVEAGLTQEENDSLLNLAAEIIKLATLHDSEAGAKVIMLLPENQSE